MDRKNIFKIIILIILLAIFAVAGLVFYGKKEKANVNPNIAMRAQDISETDVTVDFNKQIFYDAVSKHTAQSEGKGANFAGGIISHHDLASDMIAEFFAKLSTDKKIKTFILVGAMAESARHGRY
jgi:PBP1b-binding outer membrane lipoprotein LpoB